MYPSGGPMTNQSACIFGCKALELSADEKSFYKDASPWGFILFARNIDNPDQVRALTSDLRDTVGKNVPILIDQEGGRVQRLRQPNWSEWLPPMDHMTCVSDENAESSISLRYRIIATELQSLGIDVNCAPMLDIATSQSHQIIEDRCFGRDADTVAKMGRAASEGLLAGGVLPIIKHIPGHGRANMDSHFDLPILDTPLSELRKTDFIPFQKLNDQPMAMTAHIVYTDIDPENCATQSPEVINTIRTDIGFDGLIMTDDLSMQALKGSFAHRCKASFSAGCDVVLHCNGEMNEMVEIAAATPALSGKPLTRANTALELRQTPEPFDLAAAKDIFRQLLDRAA